MDLMEKPMLAWHLSGGTTELLYVEPGLRARKIGGTQDLSAGQLIDRTGQLLGLQFPAGKALDALAGEAPCKPYPVKVRDGYFSLSGMQNKTQALHEAGHTPQEVAAFALSCVVGAVKTATAQALGQWGDLPVVFTGGVSSNRLLRRTMEPLGGRFGTPQCSTDNALGIAVLTYLAENTTWMNN
jgi:N6-L-threonylcarbamoyladenine synthase